MYCLECLLDHHIEAMAIAVCTSCGAAVCLAHADVRERAPQPVGVLPPRGSARRITCRSRNGTSPRQVDTTRTQGRARPSAGVHPWQ